MTSISDVMEKYYADHEVKPYISPERDLEAWLLDPSPFPNEIWNSCKTAYLRGILFSCGGSTLERLQQSLGFPSILNTLMGFMRQNT